MTAPRQFFAFASRTLEHYPEPATRKRYLALVVLITVALYYALYVGGGVAPLFMRELHMSFTYLVTYYAISNALGAFASLLAGAADRFGRSRLVVWGLLLVALLTLVAQPGATDKLTYAVLGIGVGFVEGVILVATPALIRDFSPQVGRATAMGMWAMGPVLGSLATSAVVSTTLSVVPGSLFYGWRTQYRLCGMFCLAVWVLAFLFLRELKPALRDQIMVNERDRKLNERRATLIDERAAHRHPWRRVLRADIFASALGVSLLLLVYYTTVAFGVIYLVEIFNFSPARANALLNWSWAVNVVSLLAGGLLSDWLRVRKPFMLVGGAGAAGLIWYFLGHEFAQPGFAAMSASPMAPGWRASPKRWRRMTRR
jgi:MFS family permease